jgi:peptide/nickel transport system substrate-binding protein
MDGPTMIRRRMSKMSPDNGGWNVFFSILDCLFNDGPATNYAIRGDGKSGIEGWPHSPKLEALRQAWLDAVDLDAERRIGKDMQLQMWQDVPYVPMGHWVRSTAHRRNIVDLPWGFAAFYGVRRV